MIGKRLVFLSILLSFLFKLIYKWIIRHLLLLTQLITFILKLFDPLCLTFCHWFKFNDTISFVLIWLDLTLHFNHGFSHRIDMELQLLVFALHLTIDWEINMLALQFLNLFTQFLVLDLVLSDLGLELNVYSEVLGGIP